MRPSGKKRFGDWDYFFNGLSDVIGSVFNHGSSWLNKQTGAALTGAERENNEFQRNERIEAQNWTAQREDTQAQRMMSDYAAAGINPMMVAGGNGVSSSSSGQSGTQPVSGASLSELMALLLLPEQKKVLESQANANNARAEESGTKTELWQVKSDEALQHIEQMKSQIETELKKQGFYEGRELLARINAQNIVYLQEAQKKLLEASAGKQDASAGLDSIHALYQAELLDKGMIEALVKQATTQAGLNSAMAAFNLAEADLARMRTAYEERHIQLTDEQIINTHITNMLMSGNYREAMNIGQGDKPFKNNFFDAVTFRVNQFFDSFNFSSSFSVNKNF